MYTKVQFCKVSDVRRRLCPWKWHGVPQFANSWDFGPPFGTDKFSKAPQKSHLLNGPGGAI